jgi:hypothetical protein
MPNHPQHSVEVERLCAEVATWCAHAAVESGLFSAALKPAETLDDLLSRLPSEWDASPANPIRRLVREVCDRRRMLLTARGVPAHADCNRVLLFVPQLADFCGLAEETGIVDRADAPAWDLWIGTATHDREFCVVSYVPEKWHDAADRAIGLSVTSALRWADGHTVHLEDA